MFHSTIGDRDLQLSGKIPRLSQAKAEQGNEFQENIEPQTHVAYDNAL